MATIDVMISEEEIAKKVEELAKQIEKDFEGEELLVVGILKGASVFVSDLIRKINLNVNIDFMCVSSYGNSTESSGTVRILKDLDVDIAGKNGGKGDAKWASNSWAPAIACKKLMEKINSFYILQIAATELVLLLQIRRLALLLILLKSL
jgi:hypothetical protein